MAAADLETLTAYRTLGARQSQSVVHIAPAWLKAGRLGDQEWAVREQLAIAALDIGQVQLANEQLEALQAQFADSPRVGLLAGLRHEALGNVTQARAAYEDLLKLDETNVSAHQRLIALALPSAQAAIPLLVAYLDTFYSDPTAWSLLADLYADIGLYSQSLTALGHLLVLQTWDSFAVTRAGETAFSLGDYHLALKHFLRAVEMQGSSAAKRARSWWGVKASVRRLLADPNTATTVPLDDLPTRSQLQRLDQAATERLLDMGGSAMTERRRVLASSSER